MFLRFHLIHCISNKGRSFRIYMSTYTFPIMCHVMFLLGYLFILLFESNLFILHRR